MFMKLAAMIVGLGAIACVLLGVRQSRIQCAHELANVQNRVSEHDRTLWRLRLEIARRITPDRVERQAIAFGPLAPVNLERYTELVRREMEINAGTTATVNASKIDFDEPQR
jgi:hypothetical protein